MTLSQRIVKLHHRVLPPETGVGWVPYLWLIYYGFFFLQWQYQAPARIELALALATTLVFLFIYFDGYRRSGWTVLPHILILLAIGTAWAPFNIGANVFFVYAGAFVAMIGPPDRAGRLLAVIVALPLIIGWLAQPNVIFWALASLGSLAVGGANIFFCERDRQNAALRLSQAEVRQLARVAERERIARDLHDLLGHRLSVIVLKSELARKLVKRDPDRAAEEIQAVENSARQALSDVREAIGGYRERTLSAEFEQARLALTSADIDLELDVESGLDIDTHTEAVLTLVIREACTNIIRHSRAHRCRIQILADDESGGVVLDISDDGGGQIRPEGGGVDGMRARIEALGGHFRIDPKARRIHARLPGGALP